MMKKHIVCFGDSNTHGYCADPLDTETFGGRFSENERWTCLLQTALGENYLILEEGLNGRTTVFDDPLTEGLSGLDSIYSCLMSHEPVDLLIIMLGTNDCKERFNANAVCIGAGLERLVEKAKTVPAWRDGIPNILLIAPPHIPAEFNDENMGAACCIEKSARLAQQFRDVALRCGCAFFDADKVAEIGSADYLHFNRRGHAGLAEALSALVPKLMKTHGS